MDSQIFALCDARSFYASCELIFRPDLRELGRVCVISSNDGAIIALTENAKAAGVKKFEPYFKQKKICEDNNVTAFSANFELYGLISARIIDIISQEVPNFERYSIDEAFLDFTGIHNPKEFAGRLRQRIWQEQRIRVGISIGTTKTLSKLGQLATKSIKQLDGVCHIENNAQRDWLAQRVKVSEVWGIGRAITQKLSDYGVTSALDFIKMPSSLARSIGGVVLERTHAELNGESCIPLEDAPAAKQQIVHSRSFGRRIKDIETLKEAVSNFVVSAAEKLRKQESYCGRLTVWLMTSPFDDLPISVGDSENIPGGTDDPRRLIKIACRLVERIFQENVPYAKAGISLIDIRPKALWQPDLFSSSDNFQESINVVMDAINGKFGRGTVLLAAQGITQSFAPKAEMLSPRYLSQWSDIPIIKI